MVAFVCFAGAASKRLPRRGRSEPWADFWRPRLDLLPPASHLTLHLLLVRRLTTRQAAVPLGLTAGTVSRRLCRLRARLTRPDVTAVAADVSGAAADVSGQDPVGLELSRIDRQIYLARAVEHEPYASLAVRLSLPETEIVRRFQWVGGWLAGRRDTARAFLRLRDDQGDLAERRAS